MKAFVFRARALLFGFALLLLSSLAAQAEARCGDVGAVLRSLATKYGEAEVWRGVAQNGTQVLITVNPDGTTWTALGIVESGQACILSAGQSWQPGIPIALGTEG